MQRCSGVGIVSAARLYSLDDGLHGASRVYGIEEVRLDMSHASSGAATH